MYVRIDIWSTKCTCTNSCQVMSAIAATFRSSGHDTATVRNTRTRSMCLNTHGCGSNARPRVTRVLVFVAIQGTMLGTSFLEPQPETELGMLNPKHQIPSEQAAATTRNIETASVYVREFLEVDPPFFWYSKGTKRKPTILGGPKFQKSPQTRNVTETDPTSSREV